MYPNDLDPLAATLALRFSTDIRGFTAGEAHETSAPRSQVANLDLETLNDHHKREIASCGYGKRGRKSTMRGSIDVHNVFNHDIIITPLTPVLPQGCRGPGLGYSRCPNLYTARLFQKLASKMLNQGQRVNVSGYPLERLHHRESVQMTLEVLSP